MQNGMDARLINFRDEVSPKLRGERKIERNAATAYFHSARKREKPDTAFAVSGFSGCLFKLA